MQLEKPGDTVIANIGALPYMPPQQSNDLWTVVRRTNNDLFEWRPCGRCGGCKVLKLDKPYDPVMVVVKKGMLRSSMMGHADFLIEAEELPYYDVLTMASGRSLGIAFNFQGDRWDVLPFVLDLAGTG